MVFVDLLGIFIRGIPELLSEIKKTISAFGVMGANILNDTWYSLRLNDT